jgi:hypothetical protein
MQSSPRDYDTDKLERTRCSLLEAASPDLQVRAVRRVFEGLRPREVRFLWANPVDLGFRADAVLGKTDLEDDDCDLASDDAKTFERIVPEILSRMKHPPLVAV